MFWVVSVCHSVHKMRVPVQGPRPLCTGSCSTWPQCTGLPSWHFKIVQRGPYHTGITLDMFKSVHYEVHTVRNSCFTIIHKVHNVDNFVQSYSNENALEVVNWTNTKMSTLPTLCNYGKTRLVVGILLPSCVFLKYSWMSTLGCVLSQCDVMCTHIENTEWQTTEYPDFIQAYFDIVVLC